MAGFRWGIILSAFYLFSLFAYPAWAVDDSTIQAIQNEVSTTKGKTDVHDDKIKNLEGGLPAETAARIAADQALQNAINNIALIPGAQGPAGPQGPPGPAYVPVPPTVRSLAGYYAMHGTRTCDYTNNMQGNPNPMPFGPPPLYALPAADPTVGYAGGGTSRSAHYKGRLTLDENGIGTWNTRMIQLNHNLVGPSQAPFILWNGSCDVVVYDAFTGDMEPTFKMDLTNCYGEINVGTDPMVISEGPDLTTLSMDVSASSETILMTAISPQVKTIWNTNSVTGYTYSQNRVCFPSHTAIRMVPRR